MRYNYKVIFLALVVSSWLLILYYNYEEVLLSACSLPDHPPVVVNPTFANTSHTTGHTISAPSTSNIGILFIMLVHNLKTIKTALVTIEMMQDPKNYFVVHVDRKVPESDATVLHKTVDKRQFKNVKIISTQSIVWGGRELLPAALDGMSLGLEWPDWHYAFLMSGDCLPIKSLPVIRSTLVDYWPQNNMAIFGEAMQSYDEVGETKKARFRLNSGQKFDDIVKDLKQVYYGTTWVTLTRPFVEWTLDNSFARNFLLYLAAAHIDRDEYTGLPSIFEESYFQTIIMHSPFADTIGKTDKCIRFEKWGGCNYQHEDRAVPCMLGDKDKPEMDDSNCIFGRKFVYKSLPEFIIKQIKSYDKNS